MSEQENNGHSVPSSRRERILSHAGQRQRRPTKMKFNDDEVDVVVRELTGVEAQRWEFAVAGKVPNTLGLLLQMSIEEPDTGELMFEPADRENLQVLGVMSLKPVVDLSAVLSGISQEDIDRAKQSLLTAPSSD